MAFTTVLVVDDFRTWRTKVCSIVQKKAELRIVAEARDGAEAIEKAEQLKPDLILLDIGLPKMNGIDAALQISAVSPDSKIVFVSQDSDPEVKKAALGTGASGYVHKLTVSSQLLAAIGSALNEGCRCESPIEQPHVLENNSRNKQLNADPPRP